MKKRMLSQHEVGQAARKALQDSSIIGEEKANRVDSIIKALFPKSLMEYPAGYGKNERGGLEGMWADVWYPKYEEHRLRIISAATWDPSKDTALVYWPGNEKSSAEIEAPCENVFPRHDLQRAWNADGTPLED